MWIVSLCVAPLDADLHAGDPLCKKEIGFCVLFATENPQLGFNGKAVLKK